VRKGDTIGAFLAKVREQLSPEFRDLRYAPVALARALLQLLPAIVENWCGQLGCTELAVKGLV